MRSILLLFAVLSVPHARGFLGDDIDSSTVGPNNRVDGHNRVASAAVRWESISEIQAMLSSGENISEHLQDWLQLADGILPHHLWQHSSRVVPWPLPEGGFQSQAHTCQKNSVLDRKVVSIYRLNPRHNAVISIATSIVERGECQECFLGMIATVYQESWDRIVGSGDTLDVESGVLSDDILVEGGLTYYIVLQFENGKKSGMEPRTHKISDFLGSWDEMMAPCDSGHSYNLTISYRAPLHKWAKTVENIPFRHEIIHHHRQASLSMGGCDAEAPMPMRASAQEIWHQIVPPSNIDVVITADDKGERAGLIHIFQENYDRNGLKSVRCESWSAFGSHVQFPPQMRLQLEANTTYYLVVDGLSDSPTAWPVLFSIEHFSSEVEHRKSDSMLLMSLPDEETGSLDSALDMFPHGDYMNICSLPYTGPPTSNAASANHLDPHQCGHSKGGRDIWYRFIPTRSMTITAEVISESGPGGEAYMTVLYVVELLPNGGFLQISCGEDMANGLGSVIPELKLRSNETYYFVVDGYLEHSIGVHTLRVQETGHPAEALRGPSTSCPAHVSHSPLVLSSQAAKDWGSACFGSCVSSTSRRDMRIRESTSTWPIADGDASSPTFVFQAIGERNLTVPDNWQAAM